MVHEDYGNKDFPSLFYHHSLTRLQDGCCSTSCCESEFSWDISLKGFQTSLEEELKYVDILSAFKRLLFLSVFLLSPSLVASCINPPAAKTCFLQRVVSSGAIISLRQWQLALACREFKTPLSNTPLLSPTPMSFRGNLRIGPRVTFSILLSFQQANVAGGAVFFFHHHFFHVS